MLGCHSSFQVYVKRKAPRSKGVHYMVHWQVLASKTFSDSLQKVLDQDIKIVNFIQAGAMCEPRF